MARKWVDRRPTVDRLTGEVTTSPRTSGASDADDAALAWAVELAGAWGTQVVAVTAGSAGADDVLRPALAAGATRAVRVDVPDDAPSAAVAAALVPVIASAAPCAVVCGDLSLDRGSGSVPALLADGLGVAQALGLVAIRYRPGAPAPIEVWRRLDGGRRERLAVTPPCVLSVEGGTARLARAALPALRAAEAAAIEVRRATPADPRLLPPPPVDRGPLRPRTQVVEPPDASLDARGRILALTGAGAEHRRGQTVTLDAPEAAERMLEALSSWGQYP